MQQTTGFDQGANRQAAVKGLAIVGFVALVFIGMVLAIYAARYVPVAIGRLASAAAYLSNNGGGNTLQVVPSNIPFNTSTTTTTATTTPKATTTPAFVKPKPVTAGTPKTTTYPIGTGTYVPSTTAVYGLPNLVTTVTGVGYVDANNVFIPSTTITHDKALAVQFRVSNAGTNNSGTWFLGASFPTRSNGYFTFTSQQQDNLAPGAYIDFTLHLNSGDVKIQDNQEIDIIADSYKTVTESNERDNEAIATITVQ